MTAPQDPFSTPPQGEPGTPAGGQPGGYGAPQYGQQPGGYGAPQPQYGQQPGGYGPPYPQAQQGTNGMAIAALVTSFFCSPLGIILGFVAKGQIKQSGQSGSGLATAGIIIGAVSMVLGVLFVMGGFLAGA